MKRWRAVVLACVGGAVFLTLGLAMALLWKTRDLSLPCLSGNAPACLELASKFDGGLGVPQSRTIARVLYQRACNSASVQGCMVLARIYEHGYGVTQDRAEAQRWYRKTAEMLEKGCSRGDSSGCWGLAELNLTGDGVARDEQKAIQLYDRACHSSQGRTAGCYDALRETVISALGDANTSVGAEVLRVVDKAADRVMGEMRVEPLDVAAAWAARLGSADLPLQTALLRALKAIRFELWCRNDRIRSHPRDYLYLVAPVLCALNALSEDPRRPESLRNEAREAYRTAAVALGPGFFAPLCEEVFSARGLRKHGIPLPTPLLVATRSIFFFETDPPLHHEFSSVWTPQTDTLVCVHSAQGKWIGTYKDGQSEETYGIHAFEAFQHVLDVRMVRIRDGKTARRVFQRGPPKTVGVHDPDVTLQRWAYRDLKKWLSAFKPPW